MSSLPTTTLRVASMLFKSRRGATADNVARTVAAIERAARDGVGLVVFPEACLTGGIGETASSDARKIRRTELRALAQGIDSAPVLAVADAVERTGVAAGVGLIEAAPNGELFNSYVVCLPGGERHVHHKLQPDGARHLARGNRFTVFDTRWGWRLAVLIGGDNYLVENARMAALLGARLLVAPHARTGASDAASAEWMCRALPARAIDNGMFVVYSDGVHDDTQAGDHAGERVAAAIVDPCGQVIVQDGQGTRDDDMIVADLDPALIGTSPGHRWLDARRPDLYARLATGRAREMPLDARGFEPGTASARGSVPVSFAMVRRDRTHG
ncbi:Nitrilase/cyanide hydratase and apolipoprotein N-acyltransferase [Paraburkholderia piptadeniae]|uniref:Nitrilase/cyanide hydratase and apolipoprotein N-acyltransferase n=1 Tax=Paraburkholderia piptadeniae TaxID=1701573 RepID=A0A1N7SSR5_9BURK|nr:nitrilase-related carbon-nitrogen hydrolase [Paraburkholderia piptadeniae]SIT50408.1 Nitrilase/cyanide hydratase and apolipoprotein N-acyltransferase [Paraburkholderia piptadeniae]